MMGYLEDRWFPHEKNTLTPDDLAYSVLGDDIDDEGIMFLKRRSYVLGAKFLRGPVPPPPFTH